MIPPEEPRGYQNLTPEMKEMIPNTLEVIPRGSSYERSDNSIGLSSFYAEASSDDPTVPFLTPTDAIEAEDMLQRIVDGRPVADYIVNTLRILLKNGTLTPAKAMGLLHVYEEVAA